jgi:multiple sugar transport system substrate-binding protein
MKRQVWMYLVLAVLVGFGIGGALATGRELTILTWNHFVPGFNQEFVRQVEEWGRINGVSVRVDFLSLPDLAARLPAEVEAKAGHDIVLLFNYNVALFKEHLVPLDDLANELDTLYGPWAEGAKFLAFLDGHWWAIPWCFQSLVATINKEAWKAIGVSVDDLVNFTWEDLLRVAPKLAEIGHPIGFAIKDTFDANGGLFPILWSFGARVVDENGYVTVVSPETRAAIEYVMKLAKYMPPDVFAWDDAGNNRFMLSGVGSWTPNPPSIWAVAVRDKLPIADSIDHAPLPSGPYGRFRVADYNSFGIWQFSPNIDLAKDLLRWLMRPDNVVKQVEASWGYNEPTLKAYNEISYWISHAPLRYYHPPVEELRPTGWPAPPGPQWAMAYNLHIVPLMFAKAVTGELTPDEAMQWAEAELLKLGFKSK